MYLLFKLLHIFFIISWFAGLFYLPRIYVNLAMVPTGSTEYRQLLGMAQRLFKFMTPLGIGAVLFGLLIPFFTGWWLGTYQNHAGRYPRGLPFLLLPPAYRFPRAAQSLFAPLVSCVQRDSGAGDGGGAVFGGV